MKEKRSADFLKEVIEWDILSWSRALDFWEQVLDGEKVGKPVTALELGGRRGGLSLWLASRGINVLCTDLRNTASTATTLHEKYPELRERITYKDMNATAIPYENRFDLVVFKSVLGAVGYMGKEAQEKAVSQIYKALKPGGLLLFAENLTASPLHDILRRRFVKWGSSWRYLTISELEDMLSQFSEIDIKTTGFAATLGRTEKQRELLAKLDNGFFNHIVPSDWQYIAYGYARK